MKTKILTIFFIFLTFYSHANEEVKKWSENMSLEFISIIKLQNDTELKENLMGFIQDNFALNSISMSLIGNISKKNSEEDLNRYKKSFLNYITESLYGLVDGYDGQTIRIDKVEEDSNGYLVFSDVFYEDRSYSIVWRVADINNNFYVLDIIIENTSYYVTKKSEFSQLLRQNKGNLNKLTDILEGKIY